jgi:DNA repair protein RecO (recombination protein O)
MPGLYRDKAVVIRAIKLGESDRILTLLTEAHGKVRAVAKGIRKTSSRFGARLEPTTHVAVQMYEGRELDTITQAEAIDHFGQVRTDLHRWGRATTMLEAAEHIAQEREPNVALYRMVVGALRSLDSEDSPLVLAGFLWKLLSLEGYHPQLNECVACGSTEDLVAMDFDDGGVRCRADRRGTAVSAEAIVLMRRMLGGDLVTALREPASSATAEAEALAVATVEHHVERRLRAVRTQL